MLNISLSGAVIPQDQYTSDPLQPRVQALLATTHAAKHGALCLCRSPALRLVVRKHASGYYLAAWPGDAIAHQFGCRFYGDDASSSEMASQGPSISFGVDGGVQCVFAVPLTTPTLAPERLHERHAERSTQHSADPMLLLQVLWEMARLNCWAKGWTRDYWRVRREVEIVASTCRLAGEKKSLSDLLFMPKPFRRDRANELDREWRDFAKVLLPDSRAPLSHRRFVLGEVKSLERTEGGYDIRLRNFAPGIMITQPIYEHLFRRFSRALTTVGKVLAHPSRVMILGLVQSDPKGERLVLVDAGVMLCNAMWIPAATGYEVALANALVDLGRSFVKPMQVNADQSVLPDFLLRDCSPLCALEVVGFESLGYQAKKESKRAHLHRQGIPVWSWRAASGEPMPSLPRANPVTKQPVKTPSP